MPSPGIQRLSVTLLPPPSLPPLAACSLDTGRLNPETYRLFDKVEKHYGIKIDYTFPDSQVRLPCGIACRQLSRAQAGRWLPASSFVAQILRAWWLTSPVSSGMTRCSLTLYRKSRSLLSSPFPAAGGDGPGAGEGHVLLLRGRPRRVLPRAQGVQAGNGRRGKGVKF